MLFKKLKKISFQILSYGIIGILVNSSAYFLFIGLTRMGIEPKLSMSLLYITVVIISFFTNRKWTFTNKDKIHQTSVKFLMVYFFGYVLNYSLLYYFVDLLHYKYEYIQALVIIFLALFNFIMFRYFVFRSSLVPTAALE